LEIFENMIFDGDQLDERGNSKMDLIMQKRGATPGEGTRPS
jgi:hypothetical protein